MVESHQRNCTSKINRQNWRLVHVYEFDGNQKPVSGTWFDWKLYILPISKLDHMLLNYPFCLAIPASCCELKLIHNSRITICLWAISIIHRIFWADARARAWINNWFWFACGRRIGLFMVIVIFLHEICFICVVSWIEWRRWINRFIG